MSRVSPPAVCREAREMWSLCLLSPPRTGRDRRDRYSDHQDQGQRRQGAPQTPFQASRARLAPRKHEIYASHSQAQNDQGPQDRPGVRHRQSRVETLPQPRERARPIAGRQDEIQKVHSAKRPFSVATYRHRGFASALARSWRRTQTEASLCRKSFLRDWRRSSQTSW